MIGQEIKKIEGVITVYKAVLKRQIEQASINALGGDVSKQINDRVKKDLRDIRVFVL